MKKTGGGGNAKSSDASQSRLGTQGVRFLPRCSCLIKGKHYQQNNYGMYCEISISISKTFILVKAGHPRRKVQLPDLR